MSQAPAFSATISRLAQRLGSRFTSELFLLAFGVLFLALGFALDVRTAPDLVIATLYSVPVALSSLAFSRRLTLSLVALALVATVGAGVFNALEQGLSVTALLNRVLAALSFVLVGALVLTVRRTTAQVSALQRGEAKAHREADLRHLLTDLSRPDTARELLQEAARGLHALFGATRVIITGASGEHLSAPHYSYPSSGSDFCEGRLSPWVVTSLSKSAPRTASARVEGKLITAGWLRCPAHDDLLVLIVRPSVAEPCALLSDVLDGLEPLLNHAERLEAVPEPQLALR